MYENVRTTHTHNRICSHNIMFQRTAYPVFPGLPPPPAIYEKVIKKFQHELDAEAEAEAEAVIEEAYDD